MGERSARPACRSKKKSQPHLNAAPEENPREFLNWRSRAPSQPVDGEAYLDIAIQRWLPNLAAGPEHFTRSALQALARMLSEEHSDRWLADVLAASSADELLRRPFAELKLAVAQNAAGRPGDALKLARQAEALFARIPNRPARMRAKLEEIYSLQRLIDGRSCLAQSTALQREIGHRGYAWMELQTALEASVCATMLGDFAAARPPLQRANELASSGYENLNLRAIGLEAALETVSGNTAVAWSMDRAGLARYFKASYAPQRGYQFYSDLSFVAQRWERWYLATLFSREAEDLIGTTTNRSMIAMAVYRHGTLAQAAGLQAEATDAFARGSKLFSELPSSGNATAIYETDGDVSRAAMESNLGHVNEAWQLLRKAEAWIPGINDITVLLRYYQTLGIVLLQRGEVDHAEAAFQRAVAISRDGYSAHETPSQRASWNEETARVYRGLTELLLRRRNQPDEALRVWEEYRSNILRPGVKLRIPVPEVTRATGSRPYGVVTYTVFNDGVGIWVFDGQGLTSRWVDVPQSELRVSAARFAGECANPASSIAAIRHDGQWLYDRLVRPIESAFRTNQPILLEPDGALAQLPFAALPGRSSQYLGDEHFIAISLGPGSDNGSGVTKQSRAVIVGSSSLGAVWARNFPPLPDATREATTLAGLFVKPNLLLASAASYSAVRKNLPEAEIFHFAGHAISDGSGGALLLADQSGAASLGASEIETLHLHRCRLAVLSACTTAVGDGAAHAEGLAGAFLRAGAHQVVATRWVVDSSAAAKYMEVLYRLLLDGAGLDEAAYHAASELRENPETAHPSFWAAFETYKTASPWLLVNSPKGN